MYYFGAKSEKNLKTCHNNIQNVLRHAIQYIDFSVIEGHRTQERQIELFLTKKSELNGTTKQSMHQYNPSLAVDIIPYKKGYNPFDGTDESELMFYQLNRQIHISARQLGVDLTWGGFWSSIIDMPHYQLA